MASVSPRPRRRGAAASAGRRSGRSSGTGSPPCTADTARCARDLRPSSSSFMSGSWRRCWCARRRARRTPPRPSCRGHRTVAAVQLRCGGPMRIEAEEREDVARGLAQLVLTVIELLRQLMERQAVRRVEAGGLTDDQIERLGQTLMALEQRMDELKQDFGLRDEDLNLDLGPLGNLLPR